METGEGTRDLGTGVSGPLRDARRVQVIATYSRSLSPFTDGKPEGRMPRQGGGGPGPRTPGFTLSPCSLPVQHRPRRETIQPARRLGRVFAESGASSHHARLMQEKTGPARAGLCRGGGGASTAGSGVTADCRGTPGHDGVGGSVQRGLAREGGRGPYMGTRAEGLRLQ